MRLIKNYESKMLLWRVSSGCDEDENDSCMRLLRHNAINPQLVDHTSYKLLNGGKEQGILLSQLINV